MNKKLFLLFTALAICMCSVSMAQFTIKGVVADTSNDQNLAYTSVSIMSAKDSILQNFTRADTDGRFELAVAEKGDYFIRYSHPQFTPFVEDIKVANALTSLDTAYLLTYENLLQEFVVKESRPITIKGDTVEYTADSFKVAEYATVDQLLKKLPGIQIDKNGKITAQGKTVSKMLVDGDEFFSDDPAIVAKMLKASDIDKVQVFDNKSEIAKATGIADENPDKAINLTLKEGAKQGYFGKLEAGAGPPKYYEGQAMINAYKGSRKLAAYMITSNTNNQGLGWEDSRNFGSGGNVSFSDDGATVTYSESDDDDGAGFGGTFSGQGVPKSTNGGASYSNKFGKDDAVKFSLNYRFSDFQKDRISANKTQYFMPDSQYVNNSNANSVSEKINHKISSRIDIKIDSTSNLNFQLSGGYAQSKQNSNTNSNYTNINNEVINLSTSSNDNNADGMNASVTANYNKTFKKKGRSLNTNLSTQLSNNEGNGIFNSFNQFFNTNTQQNFRQKKLNTSNNSNYSADLNYTEPLVEEKLFLNLNAGANFTNAASTNSSRDIDPSTGTDTLNKLYSSDFLNKVNSQSAGATLRYSSDKIKANIGGTVRTTNYENTNNFTNYTFQRDYLNFLPSARISFKRNRSENYSFSYNGSGRQPQMNQIQVMVQNTDPLNIKLGNQKLVQQFDHRFSFSTNQYKMLSNRWVYANVSYTIHQNQFNESRNISSEGVNTSQTINTNGNWDVNGWMGYGTKIKAIKTDIQLNLGGTYSKNNGLLNNVINASKNLNLNFGLSLNYWQDTGWNISYNNNLTLVSNRNSLSTFNQKNTLMSIQELDLSYVWGSGLRIGASTKWQLRGKINAQDKNNNILIANAFLEKALVKDKSLRLQISANDIFNQNVGFSRFSNSNYISETNYNIIQRYFLLKLTWDFKHSKGKEKQASSETIELN